MSLSLQQVFTAVLNDGTDLSSPTETVIIPMTGAKGVKYNKDVTTSDGTFTLGGITTIGYVRLKNRGLPITITTPGAPVIANQGTPASTTWSYKLVAVQSDGAFSAASTAGTTTTGAATLNGTNFNRLTWTSVPGADHYDIYRTTSGGTPSTTGKIGSTTGVTFDDTGLAGDAGTAPATAADNIVTFGSDGTLYPLRLRGGEFAQFRWNAVAIHHKASTRTVPVEITILDD